MSPLLLLAVVLAQGAQELNAEEVRAAPSSIASPANEYKVIAIMPLTSLGSTDEAVDTIQRVLVGEFQKVLRNQVITPAQLLELQSHVKSAFSSCEGIVTCLTEVIGGLGWDAFVVGNVAGLGEQQVINLKLIDVRTGREVKRTSEKAVADEARLIANMRKAAVELVAPEMFTGFLEVLAGQPGVQILIDGKLVGTTPLQNPRLELVAGRHAVEANGEALVPYTTMATIAYGETKQVTIALAQSSVFMGGQTPMRHRWWVWSIAGAGAIGASIGGYFNTLHVRTVDKIDRYAREGRLTAANGPELYDDEKANWQRATVFYGIGGALLLTTGVLLSFDFL
jgi:hypothetical protein